MLDQSGRWYPPRSFVPSQKLLHGLLAGRCFSVDAPGVAWSCIGFACDGSFCVVGVAGNHSMGRWRCGHGTLCITTGDVAVEHWSQIRISADCHAIFVRRDEGGVVSYTWQ